jgi:ribosome-associated protein
MSQIPKHDLDILTVISQAIYDKKGVNTIALDLREISTMTEFCIIAEGTVEKHVQALAENIISHTHEPRLIRSEGKTVGDWIVLDYGHILVHLLIPDMREKYELEHLWHEAKVIPIELKLHSNALQHVAKF